MVDWPRGRAHHCVDLVVCIVASDCLTQVVAATVGDCLTQWPRLQLSGGRRVKTCRRMLEVSKIPFVTSWAYLINSMHNNNNMYTYCNIFMHI